MQETLECFDGLAGFKDANQALIAESEAADARLAEADKTLIDLQDCQDETAAFALEKLRGPPDAEEVKRRLQKHLAEQRKRLAEAEAAINKHLANSG